MYSNERDGDIGLGNSFIKVPGGYTKDGKAFDTMHERVDFITPVDINTVIGLRAEFFMFYLDYAFKYNVAVTMNEDYGNNAASFALSRSNKFSLGVIFNL